MLRSLRSALLALALATPVAAQSVLLGNGTCAAPSLRFNSATTTGVARPAAGDTICVSTGGVARTWIDSAGIKLLNGSASRPSISFKSDLGTGFYRWGADTIGFAAGGLAGIGFTTDASNARFVTSKQIRHISTGSSVTFSSSGSQSLDISGGAAATLTGGAGSMTILAGTGNSRELFLQSTTSGGVATTFLRGDATQRALFGGDALPNNDNSQDLGLSSSRWKRVYTDSLRGVGATSVIGGAGNMAIQAGTGNGRSLALRATTEAGTAFDIARFAGNTIDTVLFTRRDGVALLRITNGVTSTHLSGASDGNMTIDAGTGVSRTMTLRTTTSAGTAKNTLVLGADSSATFLGPVRGMNGASSNVTFGNAANTGMYFTSGVVKISAGGTNVLDIANPITFYGGAGIRGPSSCTAATACYSFTDATNSGMYIVDNGTADTLGLTSRGTAFAKGIGDTLLVNSKAKAPALTAAAGTPGTICYNTTTFELLLNNAATCTVSSRRFKTDIAPLRWQDASRMVRALQASTFTYRDGGRKAIGLIAEQADSVDARLSSRDAQGRVNSVNYEQVTVLLLATVQEQQRQIARLEARVDSLMKRRP